MGDAFYDEGRNQFGGQFTHSVIDLSSGGDTIRAALRDEGAVALNLSTQFDHADVSAGHVGTAQTLANQTFGSVAVGVFDCDAWTYTALSGNDVESIDIYKWSGVTGTSPLLLNIDAWTGLPFTPSGGNLTCTPNASGIFQLQ